MKSAITLFLLGCLAALPTHAQEGDTLAKIRAGKSITIGHRDASIPFSYVSGAGTAPIGYAVDICMKVVDAIRQKLGLPDLQVRYQTVTSQNRIPLVMNGTVDLECGSTTNSMERQKQVAFSLNYIMVGVSAAVKKGSGINSFADLDGKTIATTTGTTSIPLLRAYKKNDNLEVKEIYGKDHSDAFLMLQSDRASAFVMDDVLLAGQIAASAQPGEYRILPEVLRQEPYGIMLRKDDPQFKALVDAAVKALMQSGEIQTLYAKWFTSPIPPRGVNLNFPMTQATRELYLHPTDKGI